MSSEPTTAPPTAAEAVEKKDGAAAAAATTTEGETAAEAPAAADAVKTDEKKDEPATDIEKSDAPAKVAETVEGTWLTLRHQTAVA